MLHLPAVDVGDLPVVSPHVVQELCQLPVAVVNWPAAATAASLAAAGQLTIAKAHDLTGFDDLARFGVEPTKRQRGLVGKAGPDFPARRARAFVRDKFGSATTRWARLQERIERGVGIAADVAAPPDGP